MLEGPRDSLGLVAASLGAPDEMRRLSTEAREVDVGARRDPLFVVLGGEGLGRLVARAIAAFVAPTAPCPVVVLPSGVTGGAFPERTLDVRFGRAQADPAGQQLQAPSGPSGLAERLGLAPQLVAGLVLLAQAGLGPEPDVEALAARLSDRLDALQAEGVVDRLVARIGRTLPLVHGGGPVGSVLADHAKFQVNRHGKVACWSAATPELAYDEVCSWGQHGDVTRQVFTAVFLRGTHEPPADAGALDRYADLVDEFVASVLSVEGGTGEPLADACVLAVMGEQLGLRLALAEGFDPAPAPGLEWSV
jgi:glucose/mannose-6-phosphate isomerase